MFITLENNVVVGWGTAKPDEGLTYVESDEKFDMYWEYDPSTKKFNKPDRFKFNDIRFERNRLLQASDYTQLSDSTYPSTQDAWKTYRQQLRDITKGVTDPDMIVFPEEPK
tara:strand:- start:942 stop:1274 length:333 start_codon:yes stop_codon:yes gene_type:complete